MSITGWPATRRATGAGEPATASSPLYEDRPGQSPCPTRLANASRRHRPAAAAVALAGYAVLAVTLFADAWLGPEGTIPGNGGDAGLFIWDLQWVPYAITHGMNPLLTDYILYPHGANLMWNTSIPAPAVVLWPVTAAFGPVVAYKVLMTAALALSSWCAYLALRRYADVAGAAIGGLLYGFSPFMMVHELGHANLAIAVFPPLILLLLDEILVRRRNTWWRSGALLGFMCAVQLLTGEEILLVTVACALLGSTVLAACYRSQVAARLPHLARVAAAALAVFLLIAGPPLWVQFRGPNQVRGLIRPTDQFSNDLLSPVVPSWLQRGPMLGSLQNINGETSAYLGVPLILLLGYACWRWRGRAEIRVALVVGVTAMAMSFGGVIHRGYRPSRFHGPFALFDHLPMLQNLVPARFMLFTYLMVALVVAVFVDQLVATRRWWRRRATYAVALSLLPLLPQLPYPHAAISHPDYFTGAAVRELPDGSAVLVTPYYAFEAMTWQAESHFRFRLVNGTAYRPGPAYGPGFTALGGALSTIDANPSVPLGAADVAAVAAEMRGTTLEAIVVGPGPGHDGEVAFLTSLLGRGPEVHSGVAVWRNPRPGR